MNNNLYDYSTPNKEAYMNIDKTKDNFRIIAGVKTDLIKGYKDDNAKIFFTIIIPTYNRFEYLKEAIDSVLNQEEIDVEWECIIIDNSETNSNSDTFASRILKNINDKRIRYYKNVINIGTGYNWNRGVELARGEWIVFLHDDDILYKDALKNLLCLLKKKHPWKKPLGYIHARRDYFQTTKELSYIRKHDVNYIEILDRLRSLVRGESGTGMPSCGTCILRTAYLKYGGINYDFGYTADAVLGYQIMKDYTVLVSDKALGAYRWDINETLKISSLKKLALSDYYFSQYRYSLSRFSELWGYIFGASEYSENLRYKIRLAKKRGITLGKYDFEDIMHYQKPAFAIYVLYKILQRIHFLLTLINSKYMYFIKNNCMR